MVKYATLGFPFIRVFPSHEWNDTHPLTMTASKVSACVKDSLSEKCLLNYATLGFPFIRGFPSHEWNDTHSLTMTASKVYACVKVSLSEKWMLNYTALGFPFIRGSPSMHERKPFLKRWQLANYARVKRFTFWKVSAKIYNFRVPVYKGVPLTWMKWHPSFDDDC